MAKLVTKWRYLKPDAARHAQAYIRYIATREGVEKYVEENGARPAAQAQRVLVEKLLRDFPDARRSFEYEDYARRPTVRNASEFITRTLEEHLELFDARSNYVSYIAQRPRVQRSGAHGLFTQEEDAPDLNAAARAVSEHDGNIWTCILSLRREDAARLSYDKADAYTDVSVQLPAWKDWNEELKARGGMDAVCAQPHPKLQMLEQVKDAVLARAVHAPRFVDGRYLERTFQAACSAQADEIQNSCLQKLAAGALLRARHLLCTGGETAGLDRLADRAAELYQPHKDHITQDARLRSLGGQIQKMRAAEESMPARTAGQQAELADGWLHTAAAAMAADVSCMLKMSGRENTQAEEEEVRMGFC